MHKRRKIKYVNISSFPETLTYFDATTEFKSEKADYTSGLNQTLGTSAGSGLKRF